MTNGIGQFWNRHIESPSTAEFRTQPIYPFVLMKNFLPTATPRNVESNLETCGSRKSICKLCITTMKAPSRSLTSSMRVAEGRTAGDSTTFANTAIVLLVNSQWLYASFEEALHSVIVSPSTLLVSERQKASRRDSPVWYESRELTNSRHWPCHSPRLCRPSIIVRKFDKEEWRVSYGSWWTMALTWSKQMPCMPRI